MLVGRDKDRRGDGSDQGDWLRHDLEIGSIDEV